MSSLLTNHAEACILSKASYQYFKHLLLCPDLLTGHEVQDYVPHRLMIAYFAFNGMVACTIAKETENNNLPSIRTCTGLRALSNRAGLNDDEIKLVIRQLLACYSADDGGFCSMPVSSSSNYGFGSCGPTITMTYCALHILNTLGVLRSGMNNINFDESQEEIKKDVPGGKFEKVLCFEKIQEFVLSCWVDGKGFSAQPVGKEFIHCKSSSTSVLHRFLLSEVDVRSTFSALMVLWMVSSTRERRYQTTEIGALIQKSVYSEEFRLEISTLFKLKRNKTTVQHVKHSKEEPLFWERIVETIIRCYIPHEGAFSACGGDFSSSLEYSPSNKRIHYYYRPEMISQHNGAEGHSGMTFCAVISLALLGFWKEDDSVCVDTVSYYPFQETEKNTKRCLKNMMRDSILRYCCARQGHFGETETDEEIGNDYEDIKTRTLCSSTLSAVGFQGRPNKDSDTCYSFWLLSTIALLNKSMDEDSSFVNDEEKEVHVNEFLKISSSSCNLINELGAEETFAPFLHDSMKLQKFTLMTAGFLTSSQSDDSHGVPNDDGIIGVLSKYPGVECDPVHAFLGLAGVGGTLWWRVIADVYGSADEASVMRIKGQKHRSVVSAPLVTHVILRDVLFL